MKNYLLILLLIPVFCFAHTKDEADSLINLISKSNPDDTHKLEDQLIEIMSEADFDSGKALSERLLEFSSGMEDKYLYIKTLVNAERFYLFEKKMKMLNEAYELAVKEDNDYLTAVASLYKGVAFRDNSMTDSAMFYCLKAKDLFEKSRKMYDLIGAIHLIADLHYYAGQYEKAENLYKQILNGEIRRGKTWRYYIVQNNLGLIRNEQGRYNEGEQYFNNTLAYLTSKDMTYGDSSKLAYLYRKLLEVNLLKKDLNKAEEYYYKGKFFSERFKQETELPGIYAAKGTLCYEKGKFDSAVVFFTKAYELNLASPSVRNEINIYDGFAKAYSALNDFKKANHYRILLRQAEQTSDSVYNRAKYMTMYAEYNYNNFLAEIDNYKNKQIFFVTVIIIISLSLSGISYYYIRLRKSNRKLVQKNIQIAETEGHITMPVAAGINEPNLLFTDQEISEKESKNLDEEIIRDIISRLENLMANEKLYLNPELTLNETAERLETNRSYLSKAVNSVFNINFSGYINDLRIKEIIRIISNGEHKNYNVDGLAQKAGFNNRVSFSKAFQKYTGVSPSFFIKNAASNDK